MISIYISFIPVQSKILWTFIGHCHSSSFFTFYNWTKSFHIFSRSLSICILGSAHFFFYKFSLESFSKKYYSQYFSFLSPIFCISYISIIYTFAWVSVFCLFGLYPKSRLTRPRGRFMGQLKLKNVAYNII